LGRIIIYCADSDRLTQLDVEADTLDEATLKSAHGVYTVFRVYAGSQVLRLDRHFERMRQSAVLLEQPYLVADEWLRGMMRRAVESSGLDLCRLRLTVPFSAPETALIMLDPFAAPPAELYEKGVRMGLVHTYRDKPLAKNSQFIERRREIAAAHPGDFYEYLMCDEQGHILEATSSNFYAVLDGELRTSPEGVLHGIARGMLIEVAADVLPVRLDPIHTDDLPRVAEAMLTSASRGVFPIVRIEDMPINGGLPGPIYRQLHARFEALAAQEMEPL
jgi:branched-subunit amino acid aminotransferase/4-amino-4-deoxychorismate lyase